MSNYAWVRRMSTRASGPGEQYLIGGVPSPNGGHAPSPTSLLAQDFGVPDMLGEEPVRAVIETYLATRNFQSLTPKTKALYLNYLRQIAGRFGDWPIRMFEERGARTAIRRWRDEVLAPQLRTADATVSMLRLLLNFAVEEEYIYRNPACRLGRIHTKTRRDLIWSDTQITTFLSKAPRHLAQAMLLALWTGQRQSDIINMRWDSFDGEYIRLQQQKAYRGTSGRRVKILVSPELERLLVEIKLEQITRERQANVPAPDTILTSSRGVPWSNGFKCAWRKAVANAGISGVTFHDLRGTFITLAHRAGASIKEIAEASGHDETECERLVRHHYLATGAEQVVTKLSAKHTFTSPSWWRRVKPSYDPVAAAHE